MKKPTKIYRNVIFTFSIVFWIDWDSFINAMLTLLKLLPSFRRSLNKKQKASTVQSKWENVFDKLIVFIKTNNPLDESGTIVEHPVLLAVGPAKKTILQFYVKVDGRKIPIKTNCTSIEAFDRLYQSYVVFNREYDWELKTFFDFLQYFVYDKKEGVNLTTRQKEIWKLISV